MDKNTGRELLNRTKSRFKSTRSIHPAKDTGPSSSKYVPEGSGELTLKESVASARSPALLLSEAATERKLLLAVKVAHEELGEKTAVFIGCAVAARLGGLSSEWAAKALALLLLEAVSDLTKASAYAASKIDVGRARFNFHWPSLLGVALLGGSSCALLLAAIGINCLIGEDVASVFG
jgi:hypothetical protein